MFAAMPLRILTAFALALFIAAEPAGAQLLFPPVPHVQTPPPIQAPPPKPRPQAQSQTQSPAQPKAQIQPQLQSTEPPQPVSAPYDHDLQRLSEILGALHFLRGICGTNEGQKWRNEAQSLIDAEAPSGSRHDQMVASFNRGYRGFQQSYRTCTPAAAVAVRRYLEEGAKIARDITARYAN